MKHITHPFGNTHNAQTAIDVCVVSSPVMDVLIETLENGDKLLRSDIHLLLHQEKLKQLGERVAASFVDSMQNNVGSTSSIEGLSDNQIIDTIKSKYLQSPSELSSWMQHLKDIALSEIIKVKEQNNPTPSDDVTPSDDLTPSEGNKNE